MEFIELFLIFDIFFYTESLVGGKIFSVPILPLCFLSVSLRLVCCGLDSNICRQTNDLGHITATCGRWPAASRPGGRGSHRRKMRSCSKSMNVNNRGVSFLFVFSEQGNPFSTCSMGATALFWALLRPASHPEKHKANFSSFIQHRRLKAQHCSYL